MGDTSPNGLLSGLGFGAAEYVKGRASIADLFRPGHRCGIYVLHFANGEYYAGQAVDVIRRYCQHRQTHSDIENISFKKIPRKQLNDEECCVIRKLEEANCLLRNIALVSVPLGETDFDLLMAREDQECWLDDLTSVGLSGERFEEPNHRLKYTHRFQKLLAKPYADDVIEVLRHYIHLAIPRIRQSELSFWCVSCLPGPHKRNLTAYSRVNVGLQEVLTAFTVSGEKVPIFSLHLALSPLQQAYGTDLHRLWNTHPKAYTLNQIYQSGGSDQYHIQVEGKREVLRLLDDPHIIRTIRSFNLARMRRAPSLNARSHCYDLADRLVL